MNEKAPETAVRTLEGEERCMRCTKVKWWVNISGLRSDECSCREYCVETIPNRVQVESYFWARSPDEAVREFVLWWQDGSYDDSPETIAVLVTDKTSGHSWRYRADVRVCVDIQEVE